jgi:hypothetical protein
VVDLVSQIGVNVTSLVGVDLALLVGVNRTLLVAGNRGLAFGGTKMVRVDLSWIDTNDQSLNSVIELASDLVLYLNLPVVMDLAALKVGREVLHTTQA